MIDRREPTPAQVYDEYLGPTIADPWTQVVLEHAALRSGERVLDVASGTGSVARQAAARVGRSGKVVAVDINEDMLAVGSKLALPAQAARIDWRQGDAARLATSVRPFRIWTSRSACPTPGRCGNCSLRRDSRRSRPSRIRLPCACRNPSASCNSRQRGRPTSIPAFARLDEAAQTIGRGDRRRPAGRHKGFQRRRVSRPPHALEHRGGAREVTHCVRQRRADQEAPDADRPLAHSMLVRRSARAACGS